MKNRVFIFILIVLLVLGSSGFLVYKLLYENDNTPKVTVKVSKNISGWSYSLDERDTSLMKNEFDNLKSILTSSTIDYEAYATSLAKLYIIDLYTINNKVNIYDMPCLEYVLSSIKDNFKLNVSNTLYLYLIDNSDGKRDQELPVVTSVNVSSIKDTTYTVDSTNYSGYTVNITWEYQKDLGYDKSATLTIVKVDKQLYVAKEETKDSSSSN